MTDQEKKQAEEDYLKIRVESLFSKYYEREASEEFEIISKYFGYLAEQIDARRLFINGSKDLLTSFESVLLVVQERLMLYPESIRKQVDTILKESDLGTTLATVINLPEEELRISRLIQRYGFFGKITISVLGLSMQVPERGFGISRENLFKSKLALSRLSQILKYAATIEVVDHDAGFYDLKDHYDPDLIQKAKVIALAVC